MLSAAELALARGDVADGLSRYEAGITGLRALSFPGMGDTSGYEPWTLYGESAGLVAFALHGEPPAGDDLFQVMRAKAPEVVGAERHHLDFPVAGSVLYALGAWGLFRRTMAPGGRRAAPGPRRPVRLHALLADHDALTHPRRGGARGPRSDGTDRGGARRTTRPGPPGRKPGPSVALA